MIHTLQTDPQGRIGKSLEENLQVHLPAFQTTLLAALAQRDDSAQTNRNKELRNLLEELFENYFGSQSVFIRTSTVPSEPTTSRPASGMTSNILMDHVSHLAGRYQKPLIEACIYPSVGITADSEITTKLQQWWMVASSEILWVQSPQDSGQTALASEMIALSSESDLPVVAYFCQRVDADGQALSQMEIFIDMIYSMIYQLCKCFSHHASVPIDMNASQFSALDGTTRSLPKALELIRDLLAVNVNRQLFIIDGMDILDFSDDSVLEGHLKALFVLLRGKDQHGVIKTLITTEGHSGMILDEVGWEGTVDASLSDSSDGFLSLGDSTLR